MSEPMNAVDQAAEDVIAGLEGGDATAAEPGHQTVPLPSKGATPAPSVQSEPADIGGIDWELARRVIEAELLDKENRPIPIPGDEWEKFRHHCEAVGLDPLLEQIYLRPYWDKTHRRYRWTHITSIDGYRLVAERTGQKAGSDEPVFRYQKGQLLSATQTIYKLVAGQRCPYSAVAFYSEYAGTGKMWESKGHLMLAKCAEALAHRQAFPGQLGRLYIPEEMDQAGGMSAPQDAPPARPSPPPRSPQRQEPPQQEPPQEEPPQQAPAAAPSSEASGPKDLTRAKLALLAYVKGAYGTDNDGAGELVRQAAARHRKRLDEVEGVDALREILAAELLATQGEAP